MFILKTKTKNNTKTNTKMLNNILKILLNRVYYKRVQILFSREVDIVLCTASQAVAIFIKLLEKRLLNSINKNHSEAHSFVFIKQTLLNIVLLNKYDHFFMKIELTLTDNCR